MNGNRAPTDSSKAGDKDVSSGVMVDMKACNAFASAARSARAASALAKKPRIQNEVKSFTRESLEKINLRTSNLIRDYGFLPKRSPNLQDGAQLPAKYEPFPPELLGKPVEELDQYVYEKVRATTPEKPTALNVETQVLFGWDTKMEEMWELGNVFSGFYKTYLK